MNLLWLDDDSPKGEAMVAGWRVVSAQTCAQAERILQRDPPPEWILVDLIVPQGGWGQGYLKYPGLQFGKQVLTKGPGRPRVAIYSILLTPELRELAHRAGISVIFEKRTHSFHEVLQALARYSTQPHSRSEVLHNAAKG